jgi:hypothetical protein
MTTAQVRAVLVPALVPAVAANCLYCYMFDVS